MAQPTKSAAPFRSGFAALIGRPNSGKSTLLNTVLGEELSPVTPLPQTTRRRIRGVYTDRAMQIIFSDTPGMHWGSHRLNRMMLREAKDAAGEQGVDCLCYLVDLSREFGKEESLVASVVQDADAPRLIVFNKSDLCKAPGLQIRRFFSLFPRLAGTPSVTLSAVNMEAKKQFLAALEPFIKEGPRYFDGETLTDANMRFFAAEFLRKHIILATRDEVPHAVFVEIEAYRELPGYHDIRTLIHVETTGQKGIIIGKKGALIARIRAAAEKELGRLSGCPVKISCHIKVTPHWRDNMKFLNSASFFSE
jgi:GTP-binding protein Era